MDACRVRDLVADVLLEAKKKVKGRKAKGEKIPGPVIGWLIKRGVIFPGKGKWRVKGRKVKRYGKDRPLGKKKGIFGAAPSMRKRKWSHMTAEILQAASAKRRERGVKEWWKSTGKYKRKVEK
jgi:hypothetical protein